uniref:mucosal pentraxin-like n=1 Tax=Pristiophorus japonicus TaxID=55135 RepID=UPI00398EDA1B
MLRRYCRQYVCEVLKATFGDFLSISFSKYDLYDKNSGQMVLLNLGINYMPKVLMLKIAERSGQQDPITKAGHRMKGFIPFALVVCIYLPVTASEGFQGKSLIFPGETVTSYVKLHPRNFVDLSSFTLCLRAASNVKRGYALFSYATSKSDNELLLWHNDDGTLSVYFGSIIVGFSLPMLNDLLNHICVTWESETGLITFWINGVRSLQKFGHQGGVVHGGGTTILGQEQDTVGGKFDIKQCFVGEISDVNLWDHVVSAQDIKTVSQVCHCPGGNIIDWASIQYEKIGTVTIADQNECRI